MKTKTESRLELTVAATVSGEDIASGDYVALLTETVAVPSYFWDSGGVSLPPNEMVRLRLIPENAGQPLRVITSCLPFVYARTCMGEITTIDTRQMQLVRLDRKCAKVVWKSLRAERKRTK